MHPNGILKFPRAREGGSVGEAGLPTGQPALMFQNIGSEVKHSLVNLQSSRDSQGYRWYLYRDASTRLGCTWSAKWSLESEELVRGSVTLKLLCGYAQERVYFLHKTYIKPLRLKHIKTPCKTQIQYKSHSKFP